MIPERWARVQEILGTFLELTRNERDAYLDKVCQEDPSLRDEVRSLAAEASTGSAVVGRGIEGERIGPYRIVREIGHGGMGVVYEAEQGKPVRRRVALKLIKLGMDTKQMIARFESERQALALMSHPNIAGVFDAGATGQGRPYFAMEYVPGVPIVEYCDKQKLGTTQRLQLLVQVCHGVQHAHQKGIIHRDIKSGNVLVTIQDDEAVPKIIDFGVAKATAQRLTEKTLHTEVGQVIGTPAYMSPEQAEPTNLDIDTRTDIYSLGALGYELLVGVRPFESTGRGSVDHVELRRQIREEDPAKLATRLGSMGVEAHGAAENRGTDVTSLTRQLRGDLDWIVLKALAKDRTRRYATALELADDIGRHLKHEPVVAGPPSVGYRVRKFARRHRAGVAAGVCVALALLTTVAGTTLGLIRAREAERAASQEAAKAEAINEFLQETLGSANPEEGLARDVTVVEALAAGVAKIDESFADQPEIEAAVRNTVGVTYRVLGRYEEAEEQLRMALAMREATLGDHPDVPVSLNELAVLHHDRGDHVTAAQLHRQALTMQRDLHGDEHPDVASSLNNLAVCLAEQGDYESAEPLLRESLATNRRLLGSQHRQTVVAMTSLGVLIQRQGRLDAAEPLFREAIALSRLHLRDRPQLAIGLNNLARLLEKKGDWDGAGELYPQAVAVIEETHGPGHWIAGHMRSNYGACLTSLGRYDQAEEQLLVAHAILGTAVGEQDQRTQKALGRLVALHEVWGRPDGAARYRALLR